MGLLEQLLERLEKLNARLDALENGEQTVSAAAPTPVTPSVPTTDVIEFDKNNIPWDERIHAGTKRKNADGTWSMKKGVDKDLYAQIFAELKAQYADTAAPVAPTAPAVPTPPAPPAKPGVPTPPAPPAPPKAPEATGPTVQAARLSNELINDMGVDYDLIIAGVLKPRNYDQFGSVTIEDAAAVLKDLEAWKTKLTDLNEEFAGIRKMAEGTEYVGTINDGLTAFIANHGGEGDDPATIPFANLHTLYKEVGDWANQWEPILKG